MNLGSRISAKSDGKKRESAFRRSGYAGIFSHLAGEHEEASVLIRRLEGADEDTCASLFPKLRLDLLAHARAEEEVFYPRLRVYPELEDLVAHGLEEHARISALVEQLHDGDADTQNWHDVLDQLRRLLDDHVRDEEMALFPKAHTRLDEDQAKSLLREFEDAERRARDALKA